MSKAGNGEEGLRRGRQGADKDRDCTTGPKFQFECNGLGERQTGWPDKTRAPARSGEATDHYEVHSVWGLETGRRLLWLTAPKASGQAFLQEATKEKGKAAGILILIRPARG